MSRSVIKQEEEDPDEEEVQYQRLLRDLEEQSKKVAALTAYLEEEPPVIRIPVPPSSSSSRRRPPRPSTTTTTRTPPFSPPPLPIVEVPVRPRPTPEQLELQRQEKKALANEKRNEKRREKRRLQKASVTTAIGGPTTDAGPSPYKMVRRRGVDADEETWARERLRQLDAGGGPVVPVGPLKRGPAPQTIAAAMAAAARQRRYHALRIAKLQDEIAREDEEEAELAETMDYILKKKRQERLDHQREEQEAIERHCMQHYYEIEPETPEERRRHREAAEADRRHRMNIHEMSPVYSDDEEEDVN